MSTNATIALSVFMYLAGCGLTAMVVYSDEFGIGHTSKERASYTFFWALWLLVGLVRLAIWSAGEMYHMLKNEIAGDKEKRTRG